MLGRHTLFNIHICMYLLKYDVGSSTYKVTLTYNQSSRYHDFEKDCTFQTVLVNGHPFELKNKSILAKFTYVVQTKNR